MKRLVSGVILLVFLVTFLLTYEIFWASNSFEGDRFIIVSKGENFQQVLDSLLHAGIIRNKVLADLAGRISGYTTKMQMGKYRFKSGMSNLDILKDIRFGSTVELIIVSIPEGLRPERQAHLLVKNLGIDSVRFMALVHDSSFIHQCGIESHSLIGYLAPMTYKFYWQTDELEIIRELVQQFANMFDSSMQAAMRAQQLSMNEVLTMASIVEMETSIDSERAAIAGVYYNRLRKGMRLQADPTVEFILDGGPRRLALSDLDRESPYNTYRHDGLPPGPINSPGKASILAALHPVRHKFLFFVATGLGGHRFSRTFSEHRRAIQKYHRVREIRQVMRDLN